MKKIIILLMLGLITNQLALADTRMVIKTDDGYFSAWLNDKYMRAKMVQNENSSNDPMPSGDIFSDFRSGKMYMIFDKEKLIIDMAPPAMFAGGQSDRKVKLTFKNKGAGKTIAGFKTTKYDIIAEGRKCFEMLLTKDKKYSAVMEKYNSLESAQGDAQNICEQADNQLEQLKNWKYGYPVKVTNASGQVEMLLQEFKTNQTAPKKYLAFPKGYQVSTMMEAAPLLMKSKMNNASP